MKGTTLPSRRVMLRAIQQRDGTYDGVFFTAVKTTGIFCRPTCTARSPNPENVEFFPTTQQAVLSGYRPCKRCRPMEARGTPPDWLASVLDAVDTDPGRRWRDGDLRDLGLSPERVRRWFQTHHGMTFHAYGRARRLALAMGQIRVGDKVVNAAFDHGYESLSGFNDAFRKLLGAAPHRSGSTRVLTVNRVPTPLGPMLAGATDDAICLLEFVDRRSLDKQIERIVRRLNARLVPGTAALLESMASQLAEYFDGKRTCFTVPIVLPGTTFQQSVWAALQEIPYGETRSYGEVAAAIGAPTAVRAVANANGLNRVAIVVPCHRVIGADGTLTGYGGGLWRKQRLLDLEAEALGHTATTAARLSRSR